MHSPNGGIIAQSVEQRTENPCVAGSIPADTTPQSLLVILRDFFCIKVPLQLQSTVFANLLITPCLVSVSSIPIFYFVFDDFDEYLAQFGL